MFYDAPMTQSVAPIGQKNQKLVFPDTVTNAYAKPFVVDADHETLVTSGIASMVNYAVLPPSVTGANGITNPDFNYCAKENGMVGCFAYNARGLSKFQFIG